MAENISNLENEVKNYMYGGFQRVSSYDPNMCTTAARFSPPYGKTASSQSKDNPENSYKNLIYVQSSNEAIHTIDASNQPAEAHKSMEHSYLSYHNNEMLIEQQSTSTEVFVKNQIINTGNTSVLSDGVGFDYIQQTDEVTGEPITAGIVLHRSPNGHIYQNIYVANEDGNPGEIVELVPIEASHVNHLEQIERDCYAMQPYEFPTECNMQNLEEPFKDERDMRVVEDDVREEDILAAQILEREQQRILLESTMSPLLAAVNDITQREAELLSCLNPNQVEKPEAVPDVKDRNDEYSRTFYNRSRRDSSEEDDDYNKPVETRARATLPTNYLYLGSVKADTNEPSVYAKKPIPQRTKFGPFEAEIRFTSDVFLNILRSQYPRHYPLLLIGKSRVLIVTNENTSNWMRFVRLAQSYAEQNLQIIEEDNRIYFKCNRDIKPKEELRVGYHSTYANKYNLPILEPSTEDTEKQFELNNPWTCFECDNRFPTSQELQKHLEIHDVEDASCLISKRKIKRKRKKVNPLPKNSSRCSICFKVFMTNASLKKHFTTHFAAKKPKLRTTERKVPERINNKCSLCSKKFGSEEKLKSHQQSHLGNDEKPYKCPQCDRHCATPTALAAHIRGHTNRLYSCVYCQQTFKYVMDFKKHVSSHCKDGSYSCVHCKKKYKEYHLVRKHVRIFHPALKYPCNECDRLFLHMSFLRRHKETHAKEKVFQCKECAQEFNKKQNLKEHAKIHHKVKRKRALHPVKDKQSPEKKELSPKKKKISTVKVNVTYSTEYQQFQFKCEDCKTGFKRRGMLVNHIVKRHPERNIESIEELNQPIIKLQTVFNCPHCPKMYKNNAKRKAHILKNHPGMEIPPSFRSNPILSDLNVQTVGCIKTDVQKCQLCYKQYASRTRLLAHYREGHRNETVPDIPDMPAAESPPTQILIEEQCVEPVMDIYRPPVSPENKLLKLSSAALELSSIEDRKYFDFLNERSDTTDIVGNSRTNYKIVASEFGETSSNTELNRFPELFEESIGCI